MPTNKHASFRYRVLNQCFINRGHRRWTLKDLVQEVTRYLQEEFGADLSVSQRTVQGDINVMRSMPPRGFGAPIVCKDGLYFYGDPDFTIEKIPLSREELDLLREAVALLRQLPGMPQLPALEMLLRRIGAPGGFDRFSPTWIQFETNPAVQGLEWLGPISRMISEKQVLKVHYHPFIGEPMDIALHPYLLKEWRNRWYVFGRNIEDRLWNLALDRIQDISIEKEIKYKANDVFDPETWFNDIVGVTKPDNSKLENIEFETSYLPSRYLETRPIHPSQRLVRQENNRFVFSLHVILNYELVNELLRFGGDLKVLGPPALLGMMQERRGF